MANWKSLLAGSPRGESSSWIPSLHAPVMCNQGMICSKGSIRCQSLRRRPQRRDASHMIALQLIPPCAALPLTRPVHFGAFLKALLSRAAEGGAGLGERHKAV
jgi:hypothetical protein